MKNNADKNERCFGVILTPFSSLIYVKEIENKPFALIISFVNP